MKNQLFIFFIGIAVSILANIAIVMMRIQKIFKPVAQEI
jgi:hypothetical protein